MTYLIVGLALFFAVHSVSIVDEGWRDRTAQKIGELQWKGVYAVFAIAGFALICWGYGLARQEPVVLYSPPAWSRHVTMLLMVFVFPLFLAANLPGRLKAAAQHPQVVATMIWASAHLLVNGTLADVLLFGAFLVWAVFDRISMKGRTARPIPSAPASKMNDVAAVLGGLLVFGGFLIWGHEALIGVPAY